MKSGITFTFEGKTCLCVSFSHRPPRVAQVKPQIVRTSVSRLFSVRIGFLNNSDGRIIKTFNVIDNVLKISRRDKIYVIRELLRFGGCESYFIAVVNRIVSIICWISMFTNSKDCDCYIIIIYKMQSIISKLLKRHVSAFQIQLLSWLRITPYPYSVGFPVVISIIDDFFKLLLVHFKLLLSYIHVGVTIRKLPFVLGRDTLAFSSICWGTIKLLS